VAPGSDLLVALHEVRPVAGGGFELGLGLAAGLILLGTGLCQAL